ncbi:PepSY domain-containing protein [Oscillospiraceae bacterium 50-58]
MTDRELERKLAQAITRAAPNDLEAILSRCGGQNGSVMEMKELKSNGNIIDVEVTEVKSKKKLRPWLAAACAALVLLGAGGGGLVYHQSYAVASVVSLDVNPSIELKVNRGERVISCTALNTEAAAVLFDMDGGADLKGTKLDVAVNAIVGALVREGYMDSISSAILISVEDKDQERAQRLQAELVASVDGVLKTQAPGTSVLSQVLDANTPASEYMTFDSGLSAGKAALVYKVMEMNGTLALNSTDTFDKLAALSVEELNDLLKAGEKRIPIGKPAAAMAVETYAGTAAINSAVTDVDPELDETPPHYEVKLKTAWGEFEYIVDAFTGEVLSGPKDLLNTSTTTPETPDPAPQTPGTQTPDTQNPGTQTPGTQTPGTQTPGTQTPGTQTPATPSQSQDVGREGAKKAALNNAGLSESDVTDWKIERDWDDGRLEYEVKFWCGNTEYEYTVDGYTGFVLESDIKQHGNSGTAAAADVGQDAAKQAALNHAGLAAGDVSNWKIERDWDDGRLEYEIEFWCGTSEYEYTIDGHSCAVLEHEVDHHWESGHRSSGHHSGIYHE